MVQNKQYPDITEGDYFSNYAQDGLLYPPRTCCRTRGNLLPVFRQQGTYNGTPVRHAVHHPARTLFYNKKLFAQAGISSAPQTWADVETDAAKIKALGKVGFGLPLGAGGGSGRVAAVDARQRRRLPGRSGKWTINSSANVDDLHLPQGPGSRG